MRGKLLTISASVVALAVAASAAGGAGGDAGSRGHVLHFDIAFSDSFVDLGDPGPSVGDELVGNDRLSDASGRNAGHIGLVCTVTDPSAPEEACQGTAVLPDGQIAVQFLNSPPTVKIGAITGGTGRFRNARGTFRLEELPEQTGTITFRLIG